MRVGFIGLGNMGGPMAKNVRAEGFDVTVFNRTARVAEEFAQAGGRVASSPAELGAAVEAALICVSNDTALEEVVDGRQGVLRGMKPGGIVVDHSTVSPAVSKRLADKAREQSVSYLDAPVSGGTAGAEGGTLTFMVGGDSRELDRVRPLLKSMGHHVFHCGDVGHGNVAKLVNNLIGAVNLVAAVEGLVLGVKAGVNVETLHEVVMNATGRSRALETAVPNKILAGDFAPGFALELMLKDLHLAEDVARELHVRMLATSTVVQEFIEAQGKGLGSADVTAVAQPLEQLTGVSLRR